MRVGRCFLCFITVRETMTSKLKRRLTIPGVADADNMIHITQRKFQELVRQDTRGICEAKQRMIGKDSSQTHGPCMQNCFMAQATQTSMAMHNFDLLPDDNISENGKERKDSRHSRLSIYYKEWDMIDLEAIGEISDACPALIRMSDNNDFVTTVYELC